MHSGKRYSFGATLKWTSKYILIFAIYSFLIVSIKFIGVHFFKRLTWLELPWEPISLIGIAVAFYLGFKNNSAYERIWEARKIWGGIVNVSRSFTVVVRDHLDLSHHENDKELENSKKQERIIINRHIAWLHTMALELRKRKKWENSDRNAEEVREFLGTDYTDEKMDDIKPYLSEEEFTYLMSKKNRSSHLLSMQSRHLKTLRKSHELEHFRHMQIQDLITEMYTLQGKSERIKNFPFPRQYATVTYFFIVLFIILLPFGLLSAFNEIGTTWAMWMTIPFAVLVSWVFWVMEMISRWSENPFEGNYNDVPITSMARGIEIDILQMLDEEDLPGPKGQFDEFDVVI